MSELLHVVAGDSAAMGLRQAALPGEVAVARDTLGVGPVRALDDHAFRMERAAFLASANAGPSEAILADLEALDRALLTPAGETVLWFGRDLDCRLGVLRVLDFYARHDARRRLSLAALGDGFSCFGEVAPPGLVASFSQRALAGEAELGEAQRAFAAVCGADPRASCGYVPELLSELPSAREGLPQLEQLVLEALRKGPLPKRELFARASRAGLRMGDLWFFRRLEELEPLVFLAGDDATLTDEGRDALRGEKRWQMPDRWLGGLHLGPGQPDWRRDETTGQPVLA